jgi:8-oxo-dGTP pyrophosphatase MutT (NUDIX family)
MRDSDVADTNKIYSLEATIGLPLIESAGGLVCNDDNCILLIFKRGKWDLPKGRVEGDEYQTAALREVKEETGLNINKLVITGKLVPTWHTTTHGMQKYLKKTNWFLMHYNGHNDDVKPQVEEGIIECRWVHLCDLGQYREKIHPRINYVVEFWHNNLAYAPRK